MSREELVKVFDEQVSKMREILLARNTEYAKDEDALFNIKKHGYKGIISHIQDKTARLENLVDKNFSQVRAEEIMQDNAADIANYAILFVALNKG